MSEAGAIDPPAAARTSAAPISRRRALVAAAGLIGGCAGVPSTGPALSDQPLIGKFVWHDLVTESPEAVKPFYAGLFGWEYTETTALGAPYTLVKLRGEWIAGIGRSKRKVPDQPVSQWISFLSVASVDQAVEVTRQAGGSLVAGPADLPRVGRGAVVLDPEGAPLGLLRASAGDPVDKAQPAVDGFLWNEHLSRSPGDAASFYARLAGYEVRRREQAGRTYYVLWRGRPRAGLLRNPTAIDRPVWLAYVRVSDPAASAARAASLGGRVLLAPRDELRGGTLALIADPTGAMLALQKWPMG